MICSAAIIIQALGYLPAPGATVDVPAEIVYRLSRTERIAAQVCARRFGLKWRVVNGHG